MTEKAPFAALNAATAADREPFSGLVLMELGDDAVCRIVRNAAAMSSGCIVCHIDG